MKIIAVQHNPEYMETPMDIFGVPDDIIITGNRYFDSHVTTDYENVVKALEAGEDMNGFGDGYSWYRNATDYFTSELPRRGGYSTHEVGKLKKLFEAYGECDRDDQEIIAKVLSIVTGQCYEWHTIRGYSQSEWNDVLMPDIYDVKDVESEYFGLGAEFDIAIIRDEWKTFSHFDMENVDEVLDYVACNGDEYGVYIHNSYNVEEQIAKYYDVDVKDVIMILFDGYNQIPRYKIA